MVVFVGFNEARLSKASMQSNSSTRSGLPGLGVLRIDCAVAFQTEFTRALKHDRGSGVVLRN